MAPSDVLDEVRDLVKKLESRLGKVEARLDGRDPDEQSQLQSMRMILMGPPGAGKFPPCSVFSLKLGLKELRLTCTLGKGTQAPKIKDKYCICHLVLC